LLFNEEAAGMRHTRRTSRPLHGGESLLLLTAALFYAWAGGVLTYIVSGFTQKVAAQAASGAGRTVWDGVYTEAQAARATPIFNQSCSNCHTLGSQGRGPLVGEKFWQGYTQKTVGDLLTYVSTSMPNGNGGSLPASSYNDLVALILKSNGFPAGNADLSPETVAKGGPGELPDNALVRIVGCLARNGNDWVLTRATAPVRVERTGASPEDATRALGDRTTTLKFVLTRLDSFVGQRMSVSGLLIGDGGANGLNVTTVNRVAETCP
jgi:mono/diheme cytochrome c family protein